jgi:hypothetical protein
MLDAWTWRPSDAQRLHALSDRSRLGSNQLSARLRTGSSSAREKKEILPQRWRMRWRQPPSQRLRRWPPSEWRRPRSLTATASFPNCDGARRPPSPSAAAAVVAASFPNSGGGGGDGLLPNGAGLVPQRRRPLSPTAMARGDFLPQRRLRPPSPTAMAATHLLVHRILPQQQLCMGAV